MARPVVAQLSLSSLRSALAQSTRGGGGKDSHKDKSKRLASSTESEPHVEKEPMQYPVGRSTLQLTGAHFFLSGDTTGSDDEGFLVLLKAHVGGHLDAAPRVFTLAAVPLGGRSIDRSNGGNRATSTFAKLDLRLQMEKISFSLAVLPARRSSGHPSRGKTSTPADCGLRVTVMGVISPLML
ncbi:unnamed protein product [Trypanosoma congolense IL3000]|uniref:WGS project CAEQ00000000 data, annotated contig 872 n=1 Tax=Trypanosoma congolense (strain IL3000) TaxID=1068625 RepID=F9WJ49_TRYCI|nr:unnamed protein product [Trypanosoma congolense IL3000]